MSKVAGAIVLLTLLSCFAVNPNVASAGEKEEVVCRWALSEAYAPGMAEFTRCETKWEAIGSLKVTIHLQGGLLGTRYVLKGRIFNEGNYVKTKWSYWDSPLIPKDVSRRVELVKDKWNF